MRKVIKVTRRCYATARRNLPYNTNLPLFKPSSSVGYYYHSKPYIKKSTVRKISQLPKATWSLAELNLSSTSPAGSSDDDIRTHTITSYSNSKKMNRPPMSDVELDELAYRCLINVHILPSSDSERLKSDLDNIMRCVSIVTDARNSNTTDCDASIDTAYISHTTLDLPLNKKEEAQKTSCDDSSKSVITDSSNDHVGGCTVRSRTHEIDAWDADDKLEAEDVLKRLRGSKMIVRQGGRKKGDGGDYLEDWYFSLVTTTTKEVVEEDER
eukprot:CAMPEP_0198267358 /NCGR_PEP_ID=MMETSP1447-20131203/32666_1 /TAXON_ID=420782 /ORGANISM="Chaetoceros dichaeta, Strain CCMP1751" /LENGTH=268 /DNA_ID=CAMNT_0043957911 /DNA_START=8 /DNA_END=814 /DNA_ORIENTATION=-